MRTLRWIISGAAVGNVMAGGTAFLVAVWLPAEWSLVLIPCAYLGGAIGGGLWGWRVAKERADAPQA
jgi:ABC-type uncharacterized transport system permease subunit